MYNVVCGVRKYPRTRIDFIYIIQCSVYIERIYDMSLEYELW